MCPSTQVRIWQSLAVLTSFIHSPPSRVEAALRGVVGLMSANDAPSVKQYQEATAAALLMKQVRVPLLFVCQSTHVSQRCRK